jgi:hypothetical protein
VSTIPSAPGASTNDQHITETKGKKMTLTTNPEGNVDNQAGGGPSWAHDETRHAWWILPGRLLAGEYPGSLDSAKAAHKRQVLLDAGVSSFVNLTEAGELAGGGQPLEPYHPVICAEAESRGLAPPRHARFPIPDTNVIADAGYDRILEYIRQELADNQVVYFHCWGGKGRTGTVAGTWLIESEGLDYESTLRRLRELRRGTSEGDHQVPDTRPQYEVLRRRAQRKGREHD